MSESASDTVRDASDVGIPCSICSAIDFLPFRCAHCQLVFCKEHSNQARPEGHDCPAYSSTIVPQNEQKSDGSATFKGLLPDRSAKQEAPLTPEELEKQKKKEAALAILHKNFPNTNPNATTSTSVSTSKATNKNVTAPVNRTIMVMKLKQNAKALDPLRSEKQIPIKERRFFFAKTSDEEENRPFWLPKNCSCGKALDLLTTALKVANKNNAASTPASERIVLVSIGASGAKTPLSTGKSIEDAIADGDEVRVVKGSQLSS